MNAESNGTNSSGGNPSPASIVWSIVLALIALFFGFGGIGFAVIALAAVAGRATGSELATILGISAFSFAVAGACIFAIVSLNRRR